MSTEDTIVAWLLKIQRRQLANDTGDGCMAAGLIWNYLKDRTAEPLSKTATRKLLNRMADEGLIRKMVYANATLYRSINPLPWEPGGSWPKEARP